MIRIVALILVMPALISCTWVKPTDAGASVAVSTLGEVANCRVMGTTVVAIRDRVWRFNRNSEKVALELETLARNRGAVLNGDTVVPIGPVGEGEREYRIYLCEQN